MKRSHLAACSFIVSLLTFITSPISAQTPLPPHDKLLREIYQELVEINTTDSVGRCTEAAKAMAARLKGNGAKKPLMLLAHIDVVEAKREDWERDPFKLVEEGGFFYARGS